MQKLTFLEEIFFLLKSSLGYMFALSQELPGVLEHLLIYSPNSVINSLPRMAPYLRETFKY